MPRVIYISGLYHSGSTLLDLLLGNHPQVVSLGEIDLAIRPNRRAERMCTCGLPESECPIWRPVLERLERAGWRIPYSDRYQLVVDAVEKLHGPDVYISDSSKRMRTLGRIVGSRRFQVDVVYLVKDVRSYTYSQMARRNKKKLQREGGVRVAWETSALYNVWSWWRLNRKFQKRFEGEGMEVFQLGYEELCFRPELMLSRLCDRLGLAFHPDMLTPGGGTAHSLEGNRMRHDPDKLEAIRYDYRWLRSRPVVSVLTLPLLPLNRRLVYSHDSPE